MLNWLKNPWKQSSKMSMLYWTPPRRMVGNYRVLRRFIQEEDPPRGIGEAVTKLGEPLSPKWIDDFRWK